jgi:hypothetical protein
MRLFSNLINWWIVDLDESVDAQFGCLAVRRKKSKNDKKISELQMICNMWKVYTRPTCASDFSIVKLVQLYLCPIVIESDLSANFENNY